MTDTFDYVIVGGGTAGCVLANRLTASGEHTVALLEAGGVDDGFWIPIPAGFSKLMSGSAFNWRFQTEPEPNVHERTIAIPRGKGLGGSSLINGMIFVRGQPQDYDAWERAGAKGWSFADVLPYFRRLENFVDWRKCAPRQGWSCRYRAGARAAGHCEGIHRRCATGRV